MTGLANKYFITGTDTDVGKTVVTASLMVALQANDISCLPVKPVQTGRADGMDDQSWYMRFSNHAFPVNEIAGAEPYRLQLAASPHLAAQHENISLSIAHIVTGIRALTDHYDTLVIEGAGGLLVPLNRNETILDLLIALNALPIVVTRNKLGTLNHTALTLHELARNHLKPAAVIVNDMNPATGSDERIIREDNVNQIQRMADDIPVVRFPYCAEVDKNYLLQNGTVLMNALRR